MEYYAARQVSKFATGVRTIALPRKQLQMEDGLVFKSMHCFRGLSGAAKASGPYSRQLRSCAQTPTQTHMNTRNSKQQQKIVLSVCFSLQVKLLPYFLLVELCQTSKENSGMSCPLTTELLVSTSPSSGLGGRLPEQSPPTLKTQLWCHLPDFPAEEAAAAAGIWSSRPAWVA